jgi:hypothetical protein
MAPLAVAASHVACLARHRFPPGASRMGATLLALVSAESRARLLARSGCHLPVNEASDRRSSLNGGSYRTDANLHCGIVSAGP